MDDDHTKNHCIIYNENFKRMKPNFSIILKTVG